MIEIRIHGRGGQGAVVTSQLIAMAFFKSGKYVQSFPLFGVERRGAPVMAFVRIDDKFINLRTPVYNPDYVIIMDQSLIEIPDVTAGIKDSGIIIINSEKSPEEFLYLQHKVATINASLIAYKHKLGSKQFPALSTPITGAFARVSGLIGKTVIEKAIIEVMDRERVKNITAMRESYEKVRMVQEKKG